MTTQDPLATLREAVDMLDYLWTAEGLVDGFAVRDGFAAADPLREDVPAVISRARAALAATPPAIDPERQRLFEQVRAALKGARGAALDAEEPGLDQELANAIDALDRIRDDTDA